MHTKLITSAVVGMIVVSVFGAPAQDAPLKSRSIGKRQAAVQDYTCVMNAIATNGELVGSPVPPKQKRQATDPEPGDFPVKGGTITPNTFISSTGITVGIAGASKALWSSSTFDIWDMAHSQTISSADTHLPLDIEYANEGGIPTFSCGMSYNGTHYDCDTSASTISPLIFGSKDTQAGQVQFPCPMTPPGNQGAAYAPGWCTVHVVQHQKPNPATDPYKLDVTVYDGKGTIAGDQIGVVTPADVAGTLPYTLVVSTGGVDADPVQFAYGDQSWDSTSSDHQCRVGKYDSGSRQMDCGWTCQ